MWKLIRENAISGQGIGLFSLFPYQYKNKWKFSPSICTDMMDKIPVIALLAIMNKLTPIALYGRQMEEVKRRINVVTHFLHAPGHAVYFQPAVESASLQIRKILERIAFGSLIANRELYEQTYRNFSRTWKADLLLKDLARINQRYFPVPIKPNPTKRVDGSIEHELVVDGWLTPEDFTEAYEACNSLLHATNPYRVERDMKQMAEKLMLWRNKIIQLLNIHEVHFVDQRTMWVVNMQEDGDEHVHFYEFEQVDGNG
jgi:hypothetical protein